MFNLDTNALTAQFAAKSLAEKKAIYNYFYEYCVALDAGNYDSIADLFDRMVVDPDISVQTFVASFLAFNV